MQVGGRVWHLIKTINNSAAYSTVHFAVATSKGTAAKVNNQQSYFVPYIHGGIPFLISYLSWLS